MNRSAFVVLLVAVVALFASFADAGAIKGRVCPGENETWTNCGTQCEPSCALPGPRACIMSCKLDTCQCNKGFYRSKTNRCVQLHECHKY